jgi:type II secretory pathway pseudopilin PulG
MEEVLLKLNQRGFSLLEIMIGGAILMGVGLAGATLFKNQSRAQKMLEHEQELNRFHENLVKTFTNTQACNATFRNYRNTPNIPMGPLNPSDVSRGFLTCSDPALCDEFKIEPGATFSELIPPDASNKRWINNQRKWRIASLELPYTVTSSGDLKMNVSYINETEGSPKVVKKEIVVGVRFKNGTGSVFKECVNPNVSSINNVQSELCRTLNANRTQHAGAVAGNYQATWDEETQNCNVVDLSTGNQTCPAGQVFEGYQADGTINCKIINSQELKQVVTNTEATYPGCPLGSVKMVKVGTELKIQCLPIPLTIFTPIPP